MVIGSALCETLLWQKSSLATAGFVSFVFLFYPIPEVIFISSNTWYLGIINILEMDG